MPSDERTTRLMQAIVDAQPRLYAYIMTLLADPDAAHDVLQETSLTLWQKAEEFDPQRDFVAWACGVARYKVLSYRRDRGRDRHVFGDATIDRLADDALADMDAHDPRRRALHGCMQRLTDRQRELIEARYGPEGSVARIAEQTGRPANTISVTLARLRKTLADCIRAALAAKETP